MSKLLLTIFVLIAPLCSAATWESSSFHDVQSCFSGAFASLDSWMKLLRSRGKNISPEQERDMSARYIKYRARIECRNFEYLVDGREVRGFYIAPIEATKKLPLIIYNRGGNRSFGTVFFGYQLYDLFPLADQGFIVVGSQYRGSEVGGGYTGDEFGGAEVHDVLKLIELANQFPQVDDTKIGMYGVSRGGMESYLAVKATNKIRALVVQAGDSDLKASLSFRPEMEDVYKDCIPGYTSNKDKALYDRSVINWVEKLPKNMPILLLHGDKDDRVDVNRSLELSRKLKEHNYPHKLIVLEGEGHGLSKRYDEAFRSVIEWFRLYLKA